ncbi:efflux RND transporter periplasmic adaptor subunit [Thalassotalea atypica]|uniref:efflux RND transporter periplasmic adaptor subunit n=1 Tax=Thalassotalea atypica TaxID=2054316 RepID=UPI0025732810|nr:efflux RND transporter periplasmic adaptor subunit [Thalassotalea atypica]
MIKYKKLLPIFILVGFLTLAYVVKNNPPSSTKFKPSSAPQLSVEVQTLKSQNLPLKIASYGTVKPRTQSNVFPQVSGQITNISVNFREGGFFEKGEVLIQLDDRDYQAEIEIAKANLFNAKQALSEEEARVEQAQQDWIRLGNKKSAPDLVLRKPQLLAAKANVFSADAGLVKAKLALERTQIIAPFTGRILSKEVDIGQVVSSGTKLAEIYAVDYVEIRLPIKNKDLAFLNLPESSRYNQAQGTVLPKVAIYSDLIDRQTWLGTIVRTEGAFDANSQQLFVVAQIDDPYGRNNVNALPIKIGQYVTAEITGKIVDDALIIPNKAIYQGSYVYLVENGRLLRKDIDIAWQSDEFALISNGLKASDKLVLTALGQVNSGTPVSISKLDGELVVVQTKKENEQRQRSGSDKKRMSSSANNKSTNGAE